MQREPLLRKPSASSFARPQSARVVTAAERGRSAAAEADAERDGRVCFRPFCCGAKALGADLWHWLRRGSHTQSRVKLSNKFGSSITRLVPRIGKFVAALAQLELGERRWREGDRFPSSPFWSLWQIANHIPPELECAQSKMCSLARPVLRLVGASLSLLTV